MAVSDAPGPMRSAPHAPPPPDALSPPCATSSSSTTAAAAYLPLCTPAPPTGLSLGSPLPAPLPPSESSCLPPAPPPIASSSTPIPPPRQPAPTKRPKNRRACDCCRRLKIRCVVLEPIQTCAHCQAYRLECTFHLPISETRFKNKRRKPPAAPEPATYAAVAGPVSEPSRGLLPPEPPSEASPVDTSGSELAEEQEESAVGEGMIFGPTSIAHIVHSMPFVPAGVFEKLSCLRSLTLEVGPNGDGVVRSTGNQGPHVGGADDSLQQGMGTGMGPANWCMRSVGRDVLDRLAEEYFAKLATLYPVVTRSEYGVPNPAVAPEVRLAICSVAAQSRDVPGVVRESVGAQLASALDGVSFSESNLSAISAFLILSLHHDAQGTPPGAGCMWNRTGLAVRMAQDVGLHRETLSFSRGGARIEGAYPIEYRRRIWGLCVEADRCVSLYTGRPLGIDLTDCDVRLPSPEEVVRGEGSPDGPEAPRSTPMGPEKQVFAFNTEMVKVSILFGRVLKTIYSPTGLMNATDAQIEALLADIDAWHDRLSEGLQYVGPTSAPSAGILQIAYACLLVLFFRVFLRISYVCPTHLRFSVTIERMTALLDACKQACAWAALPEHVYYCDTLSFVSYALVSCATMLFHAHLRRRDTAALEHLGQIADVYAAYDQDRHSSRPSSARTDEHGRPGEQGRRTTSPLSTSTGHITWRGKCAGVLQILRDATSNARDHCPSPSHSQSQTEAASPPQGQAGGKLNPTAGVSSRKAELSATAGLRFRPDPGRPGGGVFVADDGRAVAEDLPRGTVVQADQAGAEPAASAKHSSPPASCSPPAKRQKHTTPPKPPPPFAHVSTERPAPCEWPSDSVLLTLQFQPADSGPAADLLGQGAGHPHGHAHDHAHDHAHGLASAQTEARVVTSLPAASGQLGAKSDAGDARALDAAFFLGSSAAHANTNVVGEGWAPNLNPKLNEGLWGGSAPSLLCEAPASASPSAEDAGGTLRLDPALLATFPQSLDPLDFDAWTAWGAQLTHGPGHGAGTGLANGPMAGASGGAAWM